MSEINAARLRSALEAEHRDEFVAIEPESGDYFLGRTLREAVGAARRAHPDRLTHAMRVGHKAAIHFECLTALLPGEKFTEP